MSLHLCLRVVLLPLLLALATTHLVIVIDVAALALALGVDLALTSVNAVCRHAGAPILVIAVITHAESIKREIDVRARRHNSLLGPRLTSWLAVFVSNLITLDRSLFCPGLTLSFLAFLCLCAAWVSAKGD